MRSVLVTGGCGFIGAQLAASLLADGYRVIVVDDLSSGEVARLGAACELILGDVSEPDLLDAVCAQARPQLVFHLAAQTLPPLSQLDPTADLIINAVGTIRALQAAHSVSAPLLLTSTGAVYGPDAPRPSREDTPAEPLSPYGVSKLAAEGYVRAAALNDRLAHTVCRLGNVYGPGQPPRAVVPTCIECLRAGRAPTLYDGGHKRRDFVYVDDVVQGLRTAAGRGGLYNIATGIETTTASVYAQLCALAGSGSERGPRRCRRVTCHRLASIPRGRGASSASLPGPHSRKGSRAAGRRQYLQTPSAPDSTAETQARRSLPRPYTRGHTEATTPRMSD